MCPVQPAPGLASYVGQHRCACVAGGKPTSLERDQSLDCLQEESCTESLHCRNKWSLECSGMDGELFSEGALTKQDLF